MLSSPVMDFIIPRFDFSSSPLHHAWLLHHWCHKLVLIPWMAFQTPVCQYAGQPIACCSSYEFCLVTECPATIMDCRQAQTNFELMETVGCFRSFFSRISGWVEFRSLWVTNQCKGGLLICSRSSVQNLCDKTHHQLNCVVASSHLFLV
jgi:hypothetical protein